MSAMASLTKKGGRRRWAGGLGMVALLAGILTGCASHAGASSATSTSSRVVRGGTAVVALPPLIAIDWYLPFNPIGYNNLYDHWFESAMYKSLFHIGPNAQIDYARSIASRITWNASGTLYTVKMNPKWHWSNGLPVTADDVLFTWHLIQASTLPNAPAPWPYTNVGSGGIPNLVRKVTVVNPYEFTVSLNSPVDQLWFLYNGLADFTPLPEQAWNKYPSNPLKDLEYLTAKATSLTFFEHTLIDGPFRVSRVVPNQAWTLTANPSYDGHKPYLHELVFAYETNNSNEVDQLKTGLVDVGYLPFSMAALQSQLPNDRLVKVFGYTETKTALDFKNPTVGAILRELPVRQALQLGIDQAAIIATIYHGDGVVGVGPVPSHPAMFLAPRLRHPLYSYDPAKGRHILEANGWHMVNGVMQNSRGQKLEFTMQYVAGSNSETALVQLLKQDWGQEGIEVNLEALPFATIIHNKRVPAKWEIQTGTGWDYGGSYPTGGGQYAPDGPFNSGGYVNSTATQLIDATHSPHSSLAGAQQALDRYQVYIAEQLPALWMPTPDELMEVKSSVHGVVRTTNAYTQALSPQYWWVSP